MPRRERLAPFYEVVNIKFDEAGGLTETIAMVPLAHRVDIDGPLLLAKDPVDAFQLEFDRILPSENES